MMIKNALSRAGVRTLMLVCSFALVSVAQAEEAGSQQAANIDPKLEKKIVDNLEQMRPDIKVSDLTVSPIPGVYRAQITDGPVVYVTEDAEYFIVGDLYQIVPGHMVNVSEQGRNGERLEALSKVETDDMIVFSPKGEAKAHITVFTDIDCGYCRKLHQEVPELNKMGIEVRYMAYPRAGVNSESHNKLATAWCAENPRETLTKFKSGESVPINVCKDNPVATQFNLGRQLGVTATPALILETGELQLGYLPAQQLAARLGIKP